MFFRKQRKEKKVAVGKYHLLANVAHPVEAYLTEHKYYSRNFPRIAKYIEKKYQLYSIIDVGANIGDSIALLRSYDVQQKIYAIEGDPIYFDLLQKNISQFKDAAIFKAFLGEESKTENLTNDSSMGTGRLTASAASIVIEKLDDFVTTNHLTGVKLLKIDTDGFDLKILRGAFQFIEANLPVIFFEYDAVFLEEQHENGVDIFIQLKSRGYATALFYDNYGKFLLSLNIENMVAIEQLYGYMKKREGAFQYFDVCLFHKNDDDIAKDVIEKEMMFFEGA